MNTKHTLGQWRVLPKTRMGLFPIASGNSVETCASIGHADSAANARLIAAAPELLAALKESRQVLETASRYFPKSIKNGDRFALLNVLANAVNPAIAKAEVGVE